jgi:hypothetical protein
MASPAARPAELQVVGTVGKRNTGTTRALLAGRASISTRRSSRCRACKHLLRAKAVLCPG